MVRKAVTATAGKLQSKLGTTLAQAHEAHKDDETDYGNMGELPDGIEGGIAQLVECKIDEYKKGDNKGDLFFYAAGSVVQPEVFTTKDGNQLKTAGMRTSIIIPLCETKTRDGKTTPFSDHYAKFLNALRKFGVETSAMKPLEVEAVVDVLKQQGPFFNFRTWKGAKQTEGPYAGQEPRVQHDWKGICDYSGTVNDDVVDHSSEPVDSHDSGVADNSASSEAQEGDYANMDWDQLISLAAGEDAGAQQELVKAAEEAGIDHNQYQTWEELGAVLQGGDEEGEGEWQPNAGEVYYFKPPRARTRSEFEVMKVDPAKKTAEIKNMDDGKTKFKDIPWDQLFSEKTGDN